MSSRALIALLVWVCLSASTPLAAQPSVLRLSAFNPVTAVGSPVVIDVLVDNPSGQAIGGYQVAISYPADRFQLSVAAPPTLLPGSVLQGNFQWNAPPPAGAGFPSCPLWEDGLERDVVTAIGTLDPGTGPFTGATGHLLRLTFESTALDGEIHEFRINNFEVFCSTWSASFLVNDQGSFLVTDFMFANVTFSALLPVMGLTCTSAPGGVQLSWTLGQTYSSIRLYRNGTFMGTLGPAQTQTADITVQPGVTHTYAIVGVSGGAEAPWTQCTVTVPVPPVQSLACSVQSGSVQLGWVLASFYEAILVARDGALVATLPGNAITYDDLGAGMSGNATYTVQALRNGTLSTASTCLVALGGAQFIRGDANGDGSLNIGDVLPILNHIFGLGALGCQDAGDIDDNGALQVNDPVLLLGYLFTSGAPPLPPFPVAGVDPTPDALTCAAP